MVGGLTALGASPKGHQHFQRVQEKIRPHVDTHTVEEMLSARKDHNTWRMAEMAGGV